MVARLWWVGFLLQGMLLWNAPAAYAEEPSPDLLRARSEMDALRYDAAREALDTALRSGRNSHEQLVDILRLSAEVSATLGKPDQAQTFFAQWLVLEPDAELPPGVSPKISGPFAAARSMLKKKPRMNVRHEVVSDAAPMVTVIVEADPLQMIVGARAVCRTSDGEEQVISGTGSERIEMALPAGKRLEVALAAVDRYGNRAVEFSTSARPILIEPPPGMEGKRPIPTVLKTPPPDEYEKASKPFYARWYLWGGLAVVAGATGLYFGLQAKSDKDELNDINANSEMHTFDEAQEVEDRGRRNALIANVGFAAAGAFGLVAAILGIYDLTQTQEDVAISLTPQGGSAIIKF